MPVMVADLGEVMMEVLISMLAMETIVEGMEEERVFTYSLTERRQYIHHQVSEILASRVSQWQFQRIFLTINFASLYTHSSMGFCFLQFSSVTWKTSPFLLSTGCAYRHTWALSVLLMGGYQGVIFSFPIQCTRLSTPTPPKTHREPLRLLFTCNVHPTPWGSCACYIIYYITLFSCGIFRNWLSTTTGSHLRHGLHKPTSSTASGHTQYPSAILSGKSLARLMNICCRVQISDSLTLRINIQPNEQRDIERRLFEILQLQQVGQDRLLQQTAKIQLKKFRTSDRIDGRWRMPALHRHLVWLFTQDFNACLFYVGMYSMLLVSAASLTARTAAADRLHRTEAWVHSPAPSPSECTLSAGCSRYASC